MANVRFSYVNYLWRTRKRHSVSLTGLYCRLWIGSGLVAGLSLVHLLYRAHRAVVHYDSVASC